VSQTTTTYRVTHRTEYQYEAEVSSSYGQLHLLPRELPGQRCLSTEVTIDPIAEDTASGSITSATACRSSRSTSRIAR
jgi:Bacterial transglutaminase-like N-terminal region